MRNDSQAFTRIELAAVVTALSLLGLLAVPLLAAPRADSERAACFNNLRQVGGGVSAWASDHTGEVPWLTRDSDGGTLPSGSTKTGIAWVEFLSLSNELVTARVLACPSDAGAKVAAGWTGGPNGFANTGFRQNALSYFLALHCRSDTPLTPVAGDRNFRVNNPGTAQCGVALVSNSFGFYEFDTNLGWTNAVHGFAGHLLLTDGSVHLVDSAGLRDATTTLKVTQNGTTHLLAPR